MNSVALVMTLLITAGGAAADTEIDVFPLETGNEWVYHGTLTHAQPENGCEDAAHCKAVLVNSKLDWTMKVTAVVSADGYRAALLEGHPSDLIWLQGDPRPGAWLLVRTDDGSYFLVPQRGGESLAALMNDAAKLRPLLNERDVFLRWPFPDDRRFGCDPEVNVGSQPARNCWRVAGKHRLAPTQIRGGPAHGSDVEYDLEYRTMPEDVAVRFAPRLGITRFAFHHHGSTYDLDLRLVRVSLRRAATP